jgi:Ca-activated chloride channel family protein
MLVSVLILSGLVGCSKKSENNTNDSSVGYSKSTKESTSNTADYDLPTEGEVSYDTVDAGENGMMVSNEEELQEYELKMDENFKTEENFNTEEYNTIVENNYQSVKNDPLSTFSIDVDTASYGNIRRMIYQGGMVQPDAVRIEEMINYFKYDYQYPDFDVPFSVATELSTCPWNENSKLLLIGLQAEEIDFDDRPSSNLVFLLDVSGSMNEPNKLPLMQKAFTLLTENLSENDRISMVTYAGSERVVLEGARGDETMKIVSAIEDLDAYGSTAGSAGIEKAYELAEKYFIKGGNNRVILATDGDLNVGVTSEGALTRLIEEKRESGVFLSVLGFGTDNIKDNKMEALADNGNGNYAYIDSMLEAKKVLVEEMGGTLFTVAKDVKLQVEFNPTKIKGYRLIGYENRLLNTEDFNDDTKDAGEIGAGHRVTALYELVDINSNQEIPETNLKYQNESTLVDTDEILTVNIRYKLPDSETSKLLTIPVGESIFTKEMPQNLAFASSVAAIGMILRDSKFKGNASYDMILDILEDMEFERDEYKDEFISLVKIMNRR